jgi:hypothetical protein
MKLSSLIFILILFLVKNSFAQQEGEVRVSKSRFIPYVAGGVNWNSVTGVENTSDVGPFASFNLGAGFLALINQPAPLSVTVEGIYSQQGYKINNPRRASSPEFVKLNYFNIPVVLRFNVSPKSNFYVGVGPQLGFLINAKTIGKDGSKVQLKDEVLNKTVFDAVGTVGKYFGTNNDMGVELRYQAGLSKFMTTTPDYRSSVLQLRLIIMPTFINQLLGM